MADSTRERLVERILAAVQGARQALVGWLVEQREANLRTLEAGLRERGQAVLCQLLERVLVTSPAALSRAARPCPHCQQPLVDLGPRPKTIHRTLGEMVLPRACGDCPACQRTNGPVDRQLGIDQSGRSPQLVETLALLGTELPLGPAAVRLAPLCGVTARASPRQQVTEGVGRAGRGRAGRGHRGAAAGRAALLRAGGGAGWRHGGGAGRLSRGTR
jgi:hypothetical protein